MLKDTARLPATLALLLALTCLSASAVELEERPRVTFDTTQGSFVLELDRSSAPETVDNFLEYVRAEFYRGTIFHRVIAGFMIQGGGFSAEFRQLPTRAPIRNEADRGGANDRGSIAMARIRDPHSATAQIFINVADNDFLNHRDRTPGGGATRRSGAWSREWIRWTGSPRSRPGGADRFRRMSRKRRS